MTKHDGKDFLISFFSRRVWHSVIMPMPDKAVLKPRGATQHKAAGQRISVNPRHNQGCSSDYVV